MDDGMLSTAGDQRRPDAGVWRFVDVHARETLDRIQSASVLDAGKVCLVGLDAVRSRLGPRWPGRREQIYEHALNTLRRRLAADALVQRVSETDFLVVQPGVDRLSGQALCLNCLREVLTHFLGEAVLGDVVLHEVSAIEDGHIAARKIGREIVQSLAERAPTPAAIASLPAAPVASQGRWNPFVAHDGRRLRTSCQLEPVFQLKTYERIGFRMKRRVLVLPSEAAMPITEQRALTGADLERIDLATLARGLERLRQQGETGKHPSLVLPVSFATLSSRRGRTQLAEFFRAAEENVQRGLICEVCDVEGVPPGALLAATSLMRPFCRYIIAALSTVPTGPLSNLEGGGVQGVSIECPPNLPSDDAFDDFVKAMVAAARPFVRATMLYGVAGPRQAAIASLHGATHASFAARPPAAAAQMKQGASA